MPALSLYKSCFIDPPSTLEMLLVPGKGQPGNTPGREQSVRVLLGNTLSLDSDQEGQSGDRKVEETASMEKN